MAIAAALALALAQPSIALPGQAKSTATKAGKVHCNYVTAKAFRDFSESVWRLPAWERGKPPHKVIRAKRGKVRCAKGPRHRRVMLRRWARDHRAFAAHRKEKFAERRLDALTPYGEWAIPGYVVDCESGGDWGAVNPSSGARGPYQLLPSTYYGVCDTCDWSEEDQHRAAAAVWARSGGSEWVCA